MENKQKYRDICRDKDTKKFGIADFKFGGKFVSWQVKPQFDWIDMFKNGYARAVIYGENGGEKKETKDSKYFLIEKKSLQISPAYGYTFLLYLGRFRLYCVTNDFEMITFKKRWERDERPEKFPITAEIYQIDRYSDDDLVEISYLIEDNKEIISLITGIDQGRAKSQITRSTHDIFKDFISSEFKKRNMNEMGVLYES